MGEPEVVATEVMVGTHRRELSPEERREFRELDQIVRDGMAEFIIVGACLKKIRDKKLYEADFDSFEQYARKRHDIGRSQAYRLMDAADTVRVIEERIEEMSPNGGQGIPANERQVRPLLKLSTPERRAEAWERAVERAGERGGRVTAKIVTEVVREMGGVTAREKKPPKEDGQSLAVEALNVLYDFLDRWPDDDYTSLEASVRQFLDDLERRAAA